MSMRTNRKTKNVFPVKENRTDNAVEEDATLKNKVRDLAFANRDYADIEYKDDRVIVTSKSGRTPVIVAEISEGLSDLGYKQYFITGTGRHGTTSYLDDGRVRTVFYTKEAVDAQKRKARY